MNRHDINKARIVYYRLMSSLFAFNMDQNDFDTVQQCVEILKENPIDETSQHALNEINKNIHEFGFTGLKEESDLIFFNPLTTLVPMTASFFSESRDDGQKRVEMINFVLQSPFRRDTEQYKENEDHIEFASLFMAMLIQEEIDGKEYATELSKKVFQSIFNEMINLFADKVFIHEKSSTYKHVAVLLRQFAEFERLFFDITCPIEARTDNLAKPNIIKHRKEKQPPKEMPKRNLDEFTSI